MKVSDFAKCWVYTNTFRTHDGDDVRIKSICLVKPGQDFINIFNGWCSAAGFSYICEGTMSLEEAENIQGIPDRLTLQGHLDLQPDYMPYVTYEIEYTLL